LRAVFECSGVAGIAWCLSERLHAGGLERPSRMQALKDYPKNLTRGYRDTQ
jgi:hypothetical protein